MALYRAFQAFRPEKSKQALIPALPYDVMNSDEAKEMVKDNPYSFCILTRRRLICQKVLIFTATRFTERQRKTLKS